MVLLVYLAFAVNRVVHTALSVLPSDILEEEKVSLAFTEIHEHTWVIIW